MDLWELFQQRDADDQHLLAASAADAAGYPVMESPITTCGLRN